MKILMLIVIIMPRYICSKGFAFKMLRKRILKEKGGGGHKKSFSIKKDKNNAISFIIWNFCMSQINHQQYTYHF